MSIEYVMKTAPSVHSVTKEDVWVSSALTMFQEENPGKHQTCITVGHETSTTNDTFFSKVFCQGQLFLKSSELSSTDESITGKPLTNKHSVAVRQVYYTSDVC